MLPVTEVEEERERERERESRMTTRAKLIDWQIPSVYWFKGGKMPLSYRSVSNDQTDPFRWFELR
jgi:hypothetical protein